MIDTFDTATSAGVASDWDAKRAAQDRLHAELQPRNQAASFDALAAAGVTLIVVTFDGYGDFGQIENIEAKAGDVVVAMPAGEVEIADAIWDQPRPSRSPVSIADAIERLAYDLLGKPTGLGKQRRRLRRFHVRRRRTDGSPSTTTNATPRPNTRSTCSEEAAMGNCYHHALSSVSKWGSVAEDYLPLHQWFDESRAITIFVIALCATMPKASSCRLYGHASAI